MPCVQRRSGKLHYFTARRLTRSGFMWRWSSGCFRTCARLALHRLQHAVPHRLVERSPRLSQLGREGGAEVTFQGPQQGVSKRRKMRRGHSEARMLTADLIDDRSEHLRVVEHANECGNRVHQLEMQPLHVTR